MPQVDCWRSAQVHQADGTQPESIASRSSREPSKVRTFYGPSMLPGTSRSSREPSGCNGRPQVILQGIVSRISVASISRRPPRVYSPELEYSVEADKVEYSVEADKVEYSVEAVG